jgi:hypothetical protein
MRPMNYLQSYKQVPYVIGVQGGGSGVGEGKTITEVAVAAMAHNSGYEICTNIQSLKIPHTDFYSVVLPYLDDILAGVQRVPERVMYALDDINKMWESRRAMGSLPIQLSQFIQDIRKNASGSREKASFCVFTVPQVQWADVRLWDICDLLIHTSFEEDTNTLHWLFTDPNTKEVLGSYEGDASGLFGLYNSWERILSPPPEVFETVEGKKRSPKDCPRCDSTQTRCGADGVWYCQICRYRGFKVKWPKMKK